MQTFTFLNQSNGYATLYKGKNTEPEKIAKEVKKSVKYKGTVSVLVHQYNPQNYYATVVKKLINL